MIPGQRPPADTPPIAAGPFIPGIPLTFLDTDDVEWSVVEVAVNRAALPGARAAHCLLFSRTDCIRRVWEYPAGWRLLDSIALEALSWHR
jgi:hypothetical protein